MTEGVPKTEPQKMRFLADCHLRRRPGFEALALDLHWGEGQLNEDNKVFVKCHKIVS